MRAYLATMTAVTIVVTVAMVTLGFALWLSGCGHSPRAAACAPDRLARIEAEYTADAVLVCAGRLRERCPELAELETRYAARREEWARCR